MAKTDLTIDVKANLNVDRKTAETCLRLVEIFCNDNGMRIIGNHAENGETTFEFVKNLSGISKETFDAITAIGREVHKEVDNI